MTALHLAKPEDLPRLLPLVTAFQEGEGIPQSEEHVTNALQPLLEGNPLGVIYLIGPARAPLGYIIVTFTWSLEYGGMDAFVDELYIRPAVRGRGIASEVLATLPRALGAAGVRALHLEVHQDNETAQRLYARAGFRPRDGYMLMSKPL